MNAPLMRLMTNQRSPEETKRVALDTYRRINTATIYSLMACSESAAIRMFSDAGDRGIVALSSMLRQLAALHATNRGRGLSRIDVEIAGMTALAFIEALADLPATERAEKTVADLEAQGAFGGVTE